MALGEGSQQPSSTAGSQQPSLDEGSKKPSSSASSRKPSSRRKAKELEFITPDGKMMINVQVDGSVVGLWSKRWSTHAGDYVRTCVPICYESWRYVPRNFKDDVWSGLMVEANPEEEVKRVEKWFVAHEDKNGNALASSKAYYDKLKDAVEKRKNINGEGSNISEDQDNDALTEVFGKNKKGRVRAIGYYVSKKQLMYLGVANAKFEQQKKAVEGVNALKKDILSTIKTQFVESNTMLETICRI